MYKQSLDMGYIVALHVRVLWCWRHSEELSVHLGAAEPVYGPWPRWDEGVRGGNPALTKGELPSLTGGEGEMDSVYTSVPQSLYTRPGHVGTKE
jgi:hypothetical protein